MNTTDRLVSAGNGKRFQLRKGRGRARKVGYQLPAAVLLTAEAPEASVDFFQTQQIVEQLTSENRTTMQGIQDLVVRISALENVCEMLQQRSAAPLIVPITTFAPEPYKARKNIMAVIESDVEGFTAGFFDANIYASGDTEEEALRNLKDLMLDIFDSLSAKSSKQLGPHPKRQLAVLREFIAKRSSNAKSK